MPVKIPAEQRTDRLFPPLPHRDRPAMARQRSAADSPAVTWHAMYSWALGA